MTALVVRPATSGDLDEIGCIYNHYVLHTVATFELEPVGKAELGRRLADHPGPKHVLLVVGPPGGPVLGYASSSRFRPRPAYDPTVEVSIYLAPARQRTGLGMQLYRALFETIANQDLHRAIAVIALPNEASVAFHRRWGFREVGRLPEVGRKFGRYWDVALFARPLQPGTVAVPEPEGYMGPTESDRPQGELGTG